MKKAFVFSLTLAMFTVSSISEGQSYENYCNTTFRSTTYPGLNEFCLYLIGDESMVDEEYPGYSYLYFKDKEPDGWGVYRNYNVPGYPSSFRCPAPRQSNRT